MFSIYYHIPSRLKFRSVDKAPKVTSLNELNKLVGLLKWTRDSVFVYDHRSLKKISISISKGKFSYFFEVISAEGVFWKELSEKDLFSLLDKIDQVVGSPQDFGFEVDSV